MTAEVINALGGVFHALWAGRIFWTGFVLLGLFLSLWLGMLGGVERGRECASGYPGNTQTMPRVLPWALLAGFTTLGLCIRLYGSGVLPYWWDELLAVWLAQADLPTMLRSLFTPAAPASDFTPPLFYLLLHGWFAVAGDSESSARIFTACLSTLSIPLIALVGRWFFSWATGLTAAFLLSISPPAIFYAQQVRCYSLLMDLALASVLFAPTLLESAVRVVVPSRTRNNRGVQGDHPPGGVRGGAPMFFF